MSNLYEILELNIEEKSNYSNDDIKKAFRKMALKHHPDKGGNEEDFKKISEAYQILSDPDKRREYHENDIKVELDENESERFTEDQINIISEIVIAITKVESENLKMAGLITCASTIIIGLLTKNFSKGMHAGLHLSLSIYKQKILDKVKEEYRDQAQLYLDQFLYG